jgi:Glycosyltransferase family 87
VTATHDSRPPLDRWRALTTAPPEPAGPARPVALLVLACVALAALSLLGPSTPTYDPWAWILWGREVMHLDLVTTDGPSWKPLPILFTAPFSLLGDGPAPELWVLVARAGGLLAIAMAYRLGHRLGGPVAGAIAALALLLADEFIFNFGRGNSEGLLVAICLLALERHLDGRRRDAFVLGFLAGLLRPEVWPIMALYGTWYVAVEWRGRPPWRAIALVAGAGLVTLLAWMVPEYLGSGSFLRAAERARDPNPNSAAFADFPFLEVFRRSERVLSVPVYVGALIAVAIAAARRREPFASVVATLAVLSSCLMVAVAAMTQAGFAGNLRYVALPAAMVCVLAGVGWVGLFRMLRRRLPLAAVLAAAVVALAAAAPYVDTQADGLRLKLERLDNESQVYGANLEEVIAKAGGEEAIKACGPVFTGAFQTQAVAWYLHLPETEVSIFPFPPGTMIAPNFTSDSRDPRFPVVAKTKRWMVGSTCNTP